MGVLYEHWDPLTNECFYVGASWTNEDTRPNDFSPRNKLGGYDERVANILAAGKEPEVRLIECSHLTDEELDELEIMQIAYWKDLIGDRLTNVAKGGRMGWGFAWSKDMCERHSVTMTEYYKTEKGQASVRKQTETMNVLYASDRGKEIIGRIAETLVNYYQTPAGIETAEAIGRKISVTLAALHASPEGEIVRDKIAVSARKSKLEFYQTERGQKVAVEQGELHSQRLIAWYKTPAGLENRAVRSARMENQSKGAGNPSATISEETAQKILDFEGSHKDAAKLYGVSNAVVYQIKTRRRWKHLTPTCPETGNTTSN